MTGAKIGRTVAVSARRWPQKAVARKGGPNMLVAPFDDAGFSDFGCYGSPVETPTVDALACASEFGVLGGPGLTPGHDGKVEGVAA